MRAAHGARFGGSIQRGAGRAAIPLRSEALRPAHAEAGEGVCYLPPPGVRRRASLSSSIVCSMIVAGTKLGGNERGGNSLKVSTNWPTSSITP